MVYATFAGSESYWPSSAVSSFVVDEAPAPTMGPTPVPLSLSEQYLLPGIAAIIIVIIIIGALMMMMLRRIHSFTLKNIKSRKFSLPFFLFSSKQCLGSVHQL